MTLIIAKTNGNSVRIFADSKVTHRLKEKGRNPITGALKAVILNPALCICCSGEGVAAFDAIRTLGISPDKHLDTEDVISRLYNAHCDAHHDFAFIVGVRSESYTLHRITGGKVERNLADAWIGDQGAYNLFQEHYLNAAPFCPQFDFLSEEEHRWDEVVIKTMNAFRAVIDDPTVDSVDHFMVRAGSDASGEGFRYLDAMRATGFHPVTITTTPTSLLRSVGVAGGAYSYTILTPRSAGVGMIGVYILEGRFGALFYPLLYDEPKMYHNVSLDEFREAVFRDYACEIDGIRFS